MKLSVLAAALALALAAQAAAQPSPAFVPGPSGSVIPMVTSPGVESAPANAGMFSLPHPQPVQEAARKAVYRNYRLACLPDRETVCRGRLSSEAVWECMKLHRSKLTGGCRDATFRLERAWQGDL